ncbi:MAG: DUF3298 and DUF4163 domain-containing protein [Blautia sp.]|nr:DUF3298 and DUF4163 domain-containing protein [Lachnoclostridium sp.]MCM1211120.1 DUF3298 and DUF4163 domain-containing protein [Blautia sp.]
MKRNKIRTVIAASILFCFCCSCGTQTALPQTEDAKEDAVSDKDNETLPDTTDTASAAEGVQKEQNVPEKDNIENEDETFTISIEMKTEESSENAEDGTCIYTLSYGYPIITITGHEDSAAKINADIQEIVSAFLTAADNDELQYAKDDYETRSEDPEWDYPFMPYASELHFTATRSDSNVISFVITNYVYSGGAHGFTSTTGVSYNTQTGEKISFSELAENADTFHADTLAYNQKLAASVSYQGMLFSDESIYNGELESVLYAEDSWYLSTFGLVFLSNPYALGPYAAGTIEFVIPYSDLDVMGLEEAFTYPGRLTRKLRHEESYAIDVNGDGQEDSIQFSTVYTESEDGGETTVHFIVNDMDFAQNADDELKERFLEYAWMEDYAIYDLDESDGILDFVFFTSENENDTYVTYSHFYRYGKDGSLTYVGKTTGNIYDPTEEIVLVR